MRTSIVRAYALGIISGSFLTAATLTVLDICPRHIALMQNFASAADQVA